MATENQNLKIRSLSVVIPAYNSESSLPSLVEALDGFLRAKNFDYEIILVDDSPDNSTWYVIQRLVSGYSKLSAFRLNKNFGQHNALLCGIRAGTKDFILTMDDDLQHPVSEIDSILSKAGEGWDVVYGRPRVEKHGLFRNAMSIFTKYLIKNALGASTARHSSAFRVFRTSLRDGFSAFTGPYVTLDALLTWSTTRFTSVEVEIADRKQGKSNYNMRRLVRHALNMITGFSTWPLRVASILGFATTVLGGVILGYVLVKYFVLDSVVPGFTFLASAVAIFSGVQLFTLGIIGEYLGRMHVNILGQPSYLVRDSIGEISQRNQIQSE